jgi:hypothetical protein
MYWLHFFLCFCDFSVSPLYAASVCIVLQWFISFPTVFCAISIICSWILADFWTLRRYSGHIFYHMPVHHSWLPSTYTPDPRCCMWPPWNCYLPRIGRLCQLLQWAAGNERPGLLPLFSCQSIATKSHIW